MVPNNDMIRMLTETEKVYQGEEDLRFPIITALRRIREICQRYYYEML